MDSPTTLLTALTTLIASALFAAIYKLFQISSELTELKELLKKGHSLVPGIQADSSAAILGREALTLDSESYAESLLRKVKEQEFASGGRASVDAGLTPSVVSRSSAPAADPWAEPARGPVRESRLALRDSGRDSGRDHLRPSSQELQSAAQGIALSAQEEARIQLNAREENVQLALGHREYAAENGEPAGKWSREMRRDRRAPKADPVEPMLAAPAQSPSVLSTGSQLTALSSSMNATASPSINAPSGDEPALLEKANLLEKPGLLEKAALLEKATVPPIAEPVAAAVLNGAGPNVGIDEAVNDWNLPTPIAEVHSQTPAPAFTEPAPPAHSALTPLADMRGLSPSAEMPLRTPSPLAAYGLTPPALTSDLPPHAAPVTPALDHVAPPPVPAPLAASVPGGHASVQAPAQPPAQPKVWPPEPVSEEALPTFLPASDKTIDWNMPLD